MKIHDETHLLAYDTMSLLNKMIENWKDKFSVLCYSQYIGDIVISCYA